MLITRNIPKDMAAATSNVFNFGGRQYLTQAASAHIVELFLRCNSAREIFLNKVCITYIQSKHM